MDWQRAREREAARKRGVALSDRAIAAGNYPASAAQLRYLRRLMRGTAQEVPAGLTRARASELIEVWSTGRPSLRRVAQSGSAPG